MWNENVSLAPGVELECVGSEVLVKVPDSSAVLRLRGGLADLMRRVSEGHIPEVAHAELVTELIQLGVLTSPSISRRVMVKGAAIGTGAGIALLTMPSIAAASSQEGDQGSGNGNSGPLPGEIEVNGDWAEGTSNGSEDGYQLTLLFTTGNLSDFPTGFQGDLELYVGGAAITVSWDTDAYVSSPYVGFETADVPGFTLAPGTTYYGRFEHNGKSYYATFVDQRLMT